jgi:hypothetical protein
MANFLGTRWQRARVLATGEASITGEVARGPRWLLGDTAFYGLAVVLGGSHRMPADAISTPAAMLAMIEFPPPRRARAA